MLEAGRGTREEERVWVRGHKRVKGRSKFYCAAVQHRMRRKKRKGERRERGRGGRRRRERRRKRRERL